MEKCFGDRTSLQLARLFLGASLHELGYPEEAKRHLLDMLRADPNIEIGPSIAPRDVLTLIDALRDTHKEELRKILQEMGQTEGLILDNFWLIIKIERRIGWLNLLPFGVGVFQNDDIGWGTFYASTQVAGLGLNIMGGVMVEELQNVAGRFSAQDIDNAQVWRGLQIAGISVFGASYIASVIHGWLVYNKEPEIKTILPPTNQYPEQELRKGQPQTEVDLQWVVAPFVMPDGGGAALMIVF